MELKECTKTKEELVEEYNKLDASARKMLDASYSTVVDTAASADRLEEVKTFCKKMGYQRVGVGFCKGLRKYGESVDESLSKDFEVFSVCCNVCGIDKSEIDVAQLKPGEAEVACNPLGQADALNGKDVDIIIKVGFCLGHDMLFSRNVTAPSSTLIVKDRKMGHKTVDVFQ
jgi:uncharacterized metal-binding protein